MIAATTPADIVWWILMTSFWVSAAIVFISLLVRLVKIL